MSIDLRLPSINAQSDAEKLQQLQSYMYQLVQQLNWALNNIQAAESGDTSNIVKTGDLKELSPQEAINTFNGIKSLIIKSADIVQAYSDKIQHNLEGVYVAQSDFGVYTEQTLLELNMSPTQIDQRYYNKETIDTMLTEITRANDAWIRTGLLDDSGEIPVYGMEVGQRTNVSGQEVFNKFARFTAGGIYFYLPGRDDAVAWMTDQKLFITNTEISGALKIGKYQINTDNGISFHWIGG